MPTGIDHVIILGDDLDTQIEQYKRLGFTVTPGGKHPRFTHNALITFQDGTYLELIAFYEHPEPGSTETHRWHKHLATGGGLVDYAVGAADVAATQAAARGRGVEYIGPVDGARQRLDGVGLKWRSVMPAGENVGALPFIIEDVTDRGLRVPAENATHENGVRGIHTLVVAVRDLEAALDRYSKLLGQDLRSEGTPVERDDSKGVGFAIGAQRVEVVAPTGAGPVQELLDRRGDGVFELVLLADREMTIPQAEASNARIRVVTS